MEPIDPASGIGTVSLRVADLPGATDFYQRLIGLQPLDWRDGAALLGAGSRPLVELIAAPGAPPRPARSTGLFHLAILLPDRPALGRALRRLGEHGWGLTGASDHLVSEALYTRDPEGNGIEIYRDRPREEWERTGEEYRMASLPLDLESIAAEEEPAGPPERVPAATRMGHVHLNVAEIGETERFYTAGIGMDVTVRSYPGAIFMSAGGYHHHIGANTWAGEGLPAPPKGSLGMRSFEVLVPSAAAVDAAERRLFSAGYEANREEDGLVATDPSGFEATIRATP